MKHHLKWTQKGIDRSDDSLFIYDLLKKDGIARSTDILPTCELEAPESSPEQS